MAIQRNIVSQNTLLRCNGQLREIGKKDFAILLDAAYDEYRKTYVVSNTYFLYSFKKESIVMLTALNLGKRSS
jgi:hypothetical protein